MLTCLVTRFSLPHPYWKDRTAEEYESWLDGRLDLLQRFTVPSLRNLYVKPDRWYILVGDHPFPFLERLMHVANATGIETVLVAFNSAGKAKMVADDLASRHDLPLNICTVRMDSDDVLTSGFFARLKDILKKIENPGSGVGVSFPGGAAYNEKSGDFHVLTYPDNPFLALAERVTRWDGFKGVYAEMHTELLQKLPKAIYIRSAIPMWCSVVHDGNLANASLLRDYPLRFADKDELRRKFGIIEPPTVNLGN